MLNQIYVPAPRLEPRAHNSRWPDCIVSAHKTMQQQPARAVAELVSLAPLVACSSSMISCGFTVMCTGLGLVVLKS